MFPVLHFPIYFVEQSLSILVIYVWIKLYNEPNKANNILEYVYPTAFN